MPRLKMPRLVTGTRIAVASEQGNLDGVCIEVQVRSYLSSQQSRGPSFQLLNERFGEFQSIPVAGVRYDKENKINFIVVLAAKEGPQISRLDADFVIC